jgi:hypothetical protein
MDFDSVDRACHRHLDSGSDIVFDGTAFVHAAPPEPFVLDPEPSTL